MSPRRGCTDVSASARAAQPSFEGFLPCTSPVVRRVLSEDSDNCIGRSGNLEKSLRLLRSSARDQLDAVERHPHERLGGGWDGGPRPAPAQRRSSARAGSVVAPPATVGSLRRSCPPETPRRRPGGARTSSVECVRAHARTLCGPVPSRRAGSQIVPLTRSARSFNGLRRAARSSWAKAPAVLERQLDAAASTSRAESHGRRYEAAKPSAMAHTAAERPSRVADPGRWSTVEEGPGSTAGGTRARPAASPSQAKAGPARPGNSQSQSTVPWIAQ